MAGKVGDDSECCNWMVEDQVVKLRDDVCATLVLRYDNEQTKISCKHFVIERLLDGSISDEDEVAKFEVILDDGGGMLLFKLDCGFDLSGIHVGGECCQVRSMFLQGNSAPSIEERGASGRGSR